MNLEEFVEAVTISNIQKAQKVLQMPEEFPTPFSPYRKKAVVRLLKKLQESDIYEFIVEYARAVILFTGGNVATVRNPDGFDPMMADPWFDLYGESRIVRVMIEGMEAYQEIKEDCESFGRDIETPDFCETMRAFAPIGEPLLSFEDPPTQEDYMKANYLMKFLANSESAAAINTPRPLYRGMASVPANILLDLCKPGEIYDIGGIVSASLSQQKAMSFASANYTDGRKITKWRLLYLISNPKLKGGYVAGASAYPEEEEVVIGGKIKVVGMTFQPMLRMGIAQQSPLLKKYLVGENSGNAFKKITDHATLVEYVEDIMTWEQNISPLNQKLGLDSDNEPRSSESPQGAPGFAYISVELI